MRKRPFFISVTILQFYVLFYMVINNISTSISFRPLIAFNGLSVVLSVEHKATKTKVNITQVPTISGTLVTLLLPNLSTLNIKEKDELFFRVTQNNVLLFEYIGYFIDGSVSEYRQWKNWTKTANNSKEWMTL